MKGLIELVITVAIAVADAMRVSYKHGVWFVGLASLADPDLVTSALGAK